MPTSSTPLLFPEVFDTPGLWPALGKSHGLTERDFRWLAHAKLTLATLRKEQIPSMTAERILLNVAGLPAMPLPGSFILGTTSDEDGLILYTPYHGLKKHESRASLKAELEDRLNDEGEQEDLLAFLALPQRKSLLEGGRISLSLAFIEGDIFDELGEAIARTNFFNARLLHEELRRLPTLGEMLQTIVNDLLKAHFGTLQQGRTRVAIYTSTDSAESAGEVDGDWVGSMTLTEAVLHHYRYQCWPGGQLQKYSNPDRTPEAGDQERWATAVTTASSKLKTLLFQQLELYWQGPSAEGPTRRTLFSQVMKEQARAELMLKREAAIIDAKQFETLHQLIRPATTAVRLPVYECVRLWEHPANYVELAGSLMISETRAFLYTPAQGLQVLENDEDLKLTLRSKFLARGHEDELYALLSLEERSRFLGFNEPQVSGDRIAGEIFVSLFEAIITKQRQNIEYALQVFRHSDGAVNLSALFDKALDIRSMVHSRLANLDVEGRWSTRPVITGNQSPSMVLADKASAAIKTFAAIQAPLVDALASQPLTTPALQRTYLEALKPNLAHAWLVGVNAEAKLRVMNRSMDHSQQAIVNTVLDADRSTRSTRAPLNGFRPDAYTLSVECPGQTTLLPLAHCILMTERGGIDPRHSGRAILWTPASGLEVFDNVTVARRELTARLGDKNRRLALLENLGPGQYQFHQRYEPGPLRLIQGNVLHHLMQSGIEHFLNRCEQVRSRVEDPIARQKSLCAVDPSPLFSQLRLATEHAQAIRQQQALPAWLGKAPLSEQQLQIELLEQWRHSVGDAADYLSGVPSLAGYVAQTLKSLISSRYPDNPLDPHEIEITPNLTLAGKACSLVDFAMNHINIAQDTGFRVTSRSVAALPDGLGQKLVTQLLTSLDMPVYIQKVIDALTRRPVTAPSPKELFVRQVPWQLLQHAHAMKLQQHLSETAFGYIRQILDMPDAIARAATRGAHAMVCPLSLIKTVGTAAVSALGLYVMGPGPGNKGPRVLYSPYSTQVFHEFEDNKELISALNTPGTLQELLIRRLPQDQQALFRNLLLSTVGETSELTLETRAINSNFLEYMFTDNLELLKQLLNARTQIDGQSDWETAKHLFSPHFEPVTGLFQGKAGFLPFLWQAYEDFKDSAETLQNHHWTRALKSFIEGAAQMVETALLPELAVETRVEEEVAQETLIAPALEDIDLTSPRRTTLQAFEGANVSLSELEYSSVSATYTQPSTNRCYAAIAGKVYTVAQKEHGWRLQRDETLGPALLKKDSTLTLAPSQIVHYGMTQSRMNTRPTFSRIRQTMINIEAQGMNDIRRKYPERARVLVHAIDLARFYAFNCLHNLALINGGAARGRVHLFLEDFFDVSSITADILKKIGKTIIPLCNALVDADDDLMHTDRFVVGANRFYGDVIAFVLNGDNERKVHFTEHFFDQKLSGFESCMSRPFDINGHAQASTIIHEFAHQFSKALDIATVRAREPFSDLVSIDTPQGALLHDELESDQRKALSLQTPYAQLFSTWSATKGRWLSFELDPERALVSDEIMKATGTGNLHEARNAFRDRISPETRIDVILLNADSIARLICEIGRQLDPVPTV
ncbi:MULTISPECIES: dermonecrotic toxin domain-containing protein [unclassified Pseudomonas]|uniref:dermonecrotic toxin domain-containing protein n=1 Tax=unclassified Pseudomonas TaxID=196821 RepID=UPI000A1D97AA|nr:MULTISPECIES: DUF6543 domain-containing protein [unclassified Pseudomonas]MDI2145257.1 hypothetical protein [Pseudomonas sp. ITA]